MSQKFQVKKYVKLICSFTALSFSMVFLQACINPIMTTEDVESLEMKHVAQGAIFREFKAIDASFNEVVTMLELQGNRAIEGLGRSFRVSTAENIHYENNIVEPITIWLKHISMSDLVYVITIQAGVSVEYRENEIHFFLWPAD